MNSLILQTAARFLLPLMLVFSAFLLLRGHNDPGGGFSGGLVAAGAFALYAAAFDVESARRALKLAPHHLFGIGLLIAAASGTYGLLFGHPFMQAGWWGTLAAAHEVKIGIGTPFVFDIGVYLVVLGAATLMVFELIEESQ
jgi:multicomponent Na+:H+ antiporter subunit B